jgi:hypothetical protein
MTPAAADSFRPVHDRATGPQVPRLLRRRSSAAAYGIFFLPQKFTRTSFRVGPVLRPTRLATSSDAADTRPGLRSEFCGVAAAHRLTQLGSKGIQLTGVDKSPSALAAMEPFLAGASSGSKPPSSQPASVTPAGPTRGPRTLRPHHRRLRAQ